MLKATAKSKDGHTVLVLGLSHKNLDKLRVDGLNGFIKVLGTEVGIPVDIIITASETEASLAEGFKQFIGPETKVHVSDKLKQ